MAAVGGIIGETDSLAAKIRRGLSSAVHRRGNPIVVGRGQCLVGAIGINAGTGCYDNGTWAVAVAGTITRIGGVDVTEGAVDLAAALSADGLSVLSTLSGEFAGVGTDGRRLFGFRDHLGSRPLFSAVTGSLGVIATEPKQVLSALDRSRSPNLDAIGSIFFDQWEPPDEVPSVVAGVDRVPRRALLEISPGWARRIAWTWDPAQMIESSSLDLDEAIAVGKQIVADTVGSVVREDVGVSLSGGIDSTLVAVTAAPIYASRFDQPLRSITATYPHAPAADESVYVSKTVERLGLSSVSFPSSRARLADLAVWVDRFDGPTHGVALGPLSEMNDVAAAHGIGRLLAGEMAEPVYDLRDYAVSRMIWRRRFVAAGRHLRAMRDRNVPWGALARTLGTGLIPSMPALAFVRHRRSLPEIPDWLDSTLMPGLGRSWALERPARRRWPDLQEFHATGPSYPALELSSIMGDVAGVTTWRPLASREVWDFFLSLPPEIKFPDSWSKSLVRRILDGRAPAEVVWRRDQTVFDADTHHRADYETIRGWLSGDFQLHGVDYPALFSRLDRADLSTWELSKVRNLASIHAFVGLCS